MLFQPGLHFRNRQCFESGSVFNGTLAGSGSPKDLYRYQYGFEKFSTYWYQLHLSVFFSSTRIEFSMRIRTPRSSPILQIYTDPDRNTVSVAEPEPIFFWSEPERHFLRRLQLHLIGKQNIKAFFLCQT